jgi:hypothetical protein
MLKVTVASIAVIAVLIVGLCALILWEGSSAREDAPALEAHVAQWLLHYTVPASLRSMKNPLDLEAASADVEAGHEVYTKKCESKQSLTLTCVPIPSSSSRRLRAMH